MRIVRAGQIHLIRTAVRLMRTVNTTVRYSTVVTKNAPVLVAIHLVLKTPEAGSMTILMGCAGVSFKIKHPLDLNKLL